MLIFLLRNDFFLICHRLKCTFSLIFAHIRLFKLFIQIKTGHCGKPRIFLSIIQVYWMHMAYYIVLSVLSLRIINLFVCALKSHFAWNCFYTLSYCFKKIIVRLYFSYHIELCIDFLSSLLLTPLNKLISAHTHLYLWHLIKTTLI